MRRLSDSAEEGDGSAPPGGTQPREDRKTVELTAVRLLARREHSTAELRRKLLGRGYSPASVDPVIEKLAGKRLVSDDRYVATFVRYHARRGQGPVRIRAELRGQGIDDARIEQALEAAEIDWPAEAAEVRRRKFGASPPRALGERAKQTRFLQYRGFDADQIRAALSFGSGAGGDLEQVDEPVDRVDPQPDLDTDGPTGDSTDDPTDD